MTFFRKTAVLQFLVVFFTPVHYNRNIVKLNSYEISPYLSNSITDFLKSTTLLRQLNLSYNSLSDIDNGVLSHLTKLRSVDLSYNKLKTLSIEVSGI